LEGHPGLVHKVLLLGAVLGRGDPGLTEQSDTGKDDQQQGDKNLHTIRIHACFLH
jgi:hypothetical protein